MFTVYHKDIDKQEGYDYPFKCPKCGSFFIVGYKDPKEEIIEKQVIDDSKNYKPRKVRQF